MDHTQARRERAPQGTRNNNDHNVTIMTIKVIITLIKARGKADTGAIRECVMRCAGGLYCPINNKGSNILIDRKVLDLRDFIVSGFLGFFFFRI